MTGFVIGLLVAFAGALLLAGGSELQSRAVFAAAGAWSAFVRNPRWILGLALLGTAVTTNFVALALAPIAAVQSMSIVALAASTAFSAATGRIVVTHQVKLSIVACLVGILGFIWVISQHPARADTADIDRQLIIVMMIQVGMAIACLVVAGIGGQRNGTTPRIAALIAASMQFGTITGVFKVLVGLTLRDGVAAVITSPMGVLALLGLAAGAAIAGAQFQFAHKVLPAPTVVAGLTITETLTAAAIGILVLGESALTPVGAALLLLSGSIAVGGVLGLRGLRRTEAAEIGGAGVPSVFLTPTDTGPAADTTTTEAPLETTPPETTQSEATQPETPQAKTTQAKTAQSKHTQTGTADHARRILQ